MIRKKTKVVYISSEDFIEGGYLQEANRMFFHPLGLALEAEVGEDEVTIKVWDCRDDPEGVLFGPGVISVKKYRKIFNEMKEKHHERMVRLGYSMQRPE